MRKVASPRKSQSAFTIIEVLIASAVLVIGFAAIIALIGQSNLVHDRMVDEAQASMLADEVLSSVESDIEGMWRDVRPRNGTPDIFDRAPGQRGPFEGMPSSGGLSYDVSFSYRHVAYRNIPDGAQRAEGSDNRELLVTVMVYYDIAGEERFYTAHRVVLLPLAP